MSEERQEQGVCSPAGCGATSGRAVAVGLILVFLALAFWSGEQLEDRVPLKAGPTGALTAPALRDSLRGSGVEPATLEDGIRLFENASMLFEVQAACPTVMPVFVVARGTPARGVYPHLSLRIDRHVVPGAFATSGEWGLLRLEAPLPAGRHRVVLKYDNDQFYRAEDRNLDVRSVSFWTPPSDAAAYYRWRAPCQVPPERFSRRVYAEREGQGVSVLNHGLLGDDIFFETAGAYSVRVLMGQPRRAAEASRLRMELNGVTVTNFVLAAAGPRPYEAVVKVDAGLVRLTLVNDSPFLRRPFEADIRIDAVVLGVPDLPR